MAAAIALSLWSWQATASQTDADAIARFQAEVEKYVAMRSELLAEVPGPKPESSAAELTRSSDALAAAIQRQRRNARRGDLFTPAIADAFKRRIAAAIRDANLGPALADIDDEGAGIKNPAVHLRFPAAAQMATMPPSLLAALPPLPKELEYRVVGTNLVLRDVDAALVIDVIPAAVPRK